MRKVILILNLLLIMSYTVDVFSLDTNAVKYYPMKLGNVWVTHYTTTHAYHTNYFYRRIIDSTALINGHLFYRFKITCKYISGYPQCSGTPVYGYFRIDSTSGVLYSYVGSNGCTFMPAYLIIDSLKARITDTVHSCEGLTNDIRICTDTSNQTVFGLSKPAKLFVLDYFEHYYSRRYIKDIGPYLYYSAGISGATTEILVGCVLNGVAYGDTSFITGIDPLAQEFPEYYYLSQNYPNPFNPVTTITFDISKTHNIKLTIYDVTGKEIVAIVNKEFSPGRYKASWDGASYASGVYFYSLKSESFTQTKRMVLVK